MRKKKLRQEKRTQEKSRKRREENKEQNEEEEAKSREEETGENKLLQGRKQTDHSSFSYLLTFPCHHAGRNTLKALMKRSEQGN
ncbi:hypothetical protein E2C01_086202 [Portunus trituberculatus]|uniref:Uncharacterized protein n=1 Tax=Portunus trituberculatus TaxID=210409 RepID=A0A5B7J9M7_PORTR|nr:hypothetical protein [Portunus trituberculatus]